MPPRWGYISNSILHSYQNYGPMGLDYSAKHYSQAPSGRNFKALITMSTIIHKPHRGDILIEKSEIPKVIQATLGRNINRKDVK
jgi:hypothetical protein